MAEESRWPSMSESVAYEARVLGRVGPAACEGFADFGVEVIAAPAETVLSGSFDPAGLLSLMQRIKALGLEVLDLRRIPKAE
jgi:hypothetical protein